MSFIYEYRKTNFSCFIAKNVNFLPHVHHHIEIMLVISGNLEITINDTIFSLESGDMTCIFPNQIHSGKSDGACEILFYIFSPDLIPEYHSTFINNISGTPCINSSQLSVLCRNSISDLIDMVRLNKKNYSSYNMITYKGILTVLLTDLLAKLQLKKSDEALQADLCHSTLSFLEQHFTEDISLESLSKSLGVNKFYLSRMFSNDLKMSFPEYISYRRLEFSKSLLLGTSKTINEILYLSGFQSERTFYRSFQNYYGITPKQMRQQENQEKYEK